MSAWNRLLPVCLALLFGLSPLEAYQIKSQRFVPNRYYIGQRVRVFLEIEVSPSEVQPFASQMNRSGDEKWHGSLSISDQLPKNLNYHIYEVGIFSANIPDTYAVELDYAVFTTDVSRLGSFEVQKFIIEALTIPRALSSLTGSDARSIVQELPSLESIPLSLPWVDLGIAMLIQVLVLLPILVFQSSRRLRKWFRTIYQHLLQKKPYHQFLRQLHMLQRAESLSAQEYYRILGSHVRYYLGQRILHPCSAYTTEELTQLDLGYLSGLQELWQQILAILQLGDDFRFRIAAQMVPEGLQIARTTLIDNVQKQQEVATILHFANLLEKQFKGRIHV